MRPWAGFRVARRIWLGGVAFVVMFSPILFSDLVVMIPMTMCFLFAGGPVLAYAKETPTCRSCGLSRPHPGWHETPCRPVRLLGALDAEGQFALPERPALRMSVTPPREREEESGVRPLPAEAPRSR